MYLFAILFLGGKVEFVVSIMTNGILSKLLINEIGDKNEILEH